MSEKRSLSFWQMWNLSFGFLGVQIAYALQSANISRIFATLGADPHTLSFFWILPPLMGMIVQPLIGKYSDRTWCKMGRRKPYLLVGAIIAVLVMVFLPNAGSINFSARVFLGLNAAMWFGLFSLIFLDTSINIAMQPFKMMVGDMVGEEQKTEAYSIQSFLCNAGSLFGYLFPIFFTWIGIANEAPEGVIPASVKVSFYVGAAILILCVLYTFFKVKEMPPKEYAEFHGIEIPSPAAQVRNDNSDSSVIPSDSSVISSDSSVIPSDSSVIPSDSSVIPSDSSVIPSEAKESKDDGLFRLLVKAPATFWTVGLVQFFCWAAFLYMWTYSNGMLAANCWGIDPAAEGATASGAYQAAGNWVGVVFAVQAVGSILWAMVLPRFKNIKLAYIVSLLIGAVGFVSLFFIHDRYLAAAAYFLVGAAWAAMLALPFTLLTNSLEGNPHMGSYLGLFNCTICLPQIVAAATGGLVLTLVGGKQPMMLVMAGIYLVIGAACVTLIKVKKQS